MMADVCGPYRLGPMLARGGMAEIFVAEPGDGAPAGLPDNLVVKRLLPRHSDRPDFIRLFQREAEIVRQLDHPGIVRVFDVGQDGSTHYIVMERVEGRDLKAVLSAGAEPGQGLPYGLAAFIAARVAEALDHAHALSDDEGWPLGLVHRDICPHNILISWDGAVKLSDFGIARAADRAAGVRPGQLTGRVGYLSPEQVQGLEVDARSDVFSLGVVLWEMSVGRRLFKAPSQIETMQQVQEARVTAPSELRPDCPKGLETALLRALAREVRDRPESAGAFAKELDGFLSGFDGPCDQAALGAHMATLMPTDSRPTMPAEPSPAPAPEEGGTDTAIVQAMAGEDTEDGIGTSPGRAAIGDHLPASDPGAKASPEPASDESAETSADEAMETPDPEAHSDAADDPPPEEAASGTAEDRSADQEDASISPFDDTADAETSVQDALEEARIESPAPDAEPASSPEMMEQGDPEALTPNPPGDPSEAPTPPPADGSEAPTPPPEGLDDEDPGSTPAGVVEPLGVVIGIPMTERAAAEGPESLMPPTAQVDDVPPRPARGERPRAISRVHDIPSIGDDNADDVYLALDANKRSIGGLRGVGAAVAVALLIAAVGYFVSIGNVVSEQVYADAKKVAEDERALFATIDKPVAKAAPDGVLTIRSDPPGATVFLDWQPVPQPTPTKIAVFTGQVHVIRVELAGFVAYQETLTAPTDGPGERNVLLLPEAEGPTGEVGIVTEPPGADVIIAGTPKGKTPIQIPGLAAGKTHVVVLKAAGYTEHVVVFTVDEGGVRLVNVRLSPSEVDGATKRDLNIESIPTGASVHIDGAKAGTTPLYRRLHVGDRTHIVLDKSGREPFETPVALGPAAVTMIAMLAELPPQFGHLILTSTPTKATVYIGNNEVGRTPIKNLKLPAGRHTVVVDTPKHRGSFVLNLKAGAVAKHSVRWDGAGKLILQ